MYRLILAFANWLQNTPMALAVGGSDWAYPYVQLTHFTGLSLWLTPVGATVESGPRLAGKSRGCRPVSLAHHQNRCVIGP